MDAQAQIALLEAQDAVDNLAQWVARARHRWLALLLPGDQIMAQGQRCQIKTISDDRKAFSLIDRHGQKVEHFGGGDFAPEGIHPWAGNAEPPI